MANKEDSQNFTVEFPIKLLEQTKEAARSEFMSAKGYICKACKEKNQRVNNES